MTMMNKNRPALLALVAWFFPVGLAAQESLAARCEATVVSLANAQEECFAAAQAAVSAQPALGILIAGGSPTAAGSGGLAIGALPGVSLGLRATLIGAKLPDIVTDRLPEDVEAFASRYGLTIPAVSGDLTLDVFDGFAFSPGVGGVGALALLGTSTVIPFRSLSEDFDGSRFAFGVGAQVGLIEESFITPAVAVSVVRRQLSEMSLGSVCASGFIGVQFDGGNTETGACTTDGDPGEIAFGLTSWSTRAVVSKHLVGFAGSLGVGYDRFASDLDFGFRGPSIAGTSSAPTFRVRNQELEANRWTFFGSASSNYLVTTLSAEAGWQQGDAPIPGFRELDGSFDPREGTWFGVIGLRVAL